jgi:hypothetical protein
MIAACAEELRATAACCGKKDSDEDLSETRVADTRYRQMDTKDINISL